MSSGPKSQSSQRSILVSFSGIDGAGKSTQIEKFCSLLRNAGLSVTQLAFWDNVVAFSRFRAGFSHRFLDSEKGIGRPDQPVNRRDKNVQKWYLSIPRGALYFVDAINLRRAVNAARKQSADVIVFDRYLYDQLATLPVQSPLVRAYVQMLLNIAPKPDVSFLLDADPEVARARKPEYPIDFMHRYRASYLRLCEIAHLALVPPGSIEEVHDTIVKEFEKRLTLRLPAVQLHSLTSP